MWKTLGLSVDWSMTYATIGPRAQRVSQLAFLRLVQRGLAYQLEAPTLWDVDFRTAVAQAELEDREMPGAYHRIRFARADGGAPSRSRPRVPSSSPPASPWSRIRTMSAIRPLFGTDVVTPLFGVRVPVRAHALADPAKGSGIAMICTFGDITDVTWWRELSLPVRAVIQADGTLRAVAWGSPGWESTDPERASALLRRPRRDCPPPRPGCGSSSSCRRRTTWWASRGPITHAVKFFEKGDRPLEIVTSRQWFIKTIEFRDALLARGRELQWHPAYMQNRYENWANGLNGDWCVSRQRFFGVPFPVWYPIADDGRVRVRPADHGAREPRCRWTRRRTCPRATGRTSAGGPAASPATPTSWTPGPRRR